MARATLKVEVDLDDVPGWGNLASDFQKVIQQSLDNTIGHYHPVVTLESCTDPSRLNAKSVIAWAGDEIAAGRNPFGKEMI